jgi:hypothetical protein
MEIIEEFGTDIGFKMLKKSIERQADINYKEMCKDITPDLSSLDKGVKVYSCFMEEAGAKFNIHKKDENSFTFLVTRCPFYEAFLHVGIDCGYFLGGLCTHITLPAIQSILQRFDSRLKLEPVLIRNSVEELCLERISLTD